MQKQVVKYPVTGLNQDDSDAILPQGWFREIWNAIPVNAGLSKGGGIQNIPGTTVRTNAGVASGNNTCIGEVVDKTGNRIIYFLHNSGGNHSIWQFNPISNTHTKILQTSYLGFSLSYRISGDVLLDNLNYSDGNTEDKSLIISEAIAGNYIFGSQAAYNKQTSAYKIRPAYPPTSSRLNNAAILVNNISADSFQFSTRYVYKDNTISKLSPSSKISQADLYPKFNAVNNYAQVVQSVDTDIAAVIKKVQFIYEKNNDGNLFLFAEENGTGASSYTVNFYNTESVQGLSDIETNPVSFIPNKSRNTIFHEQRAISTLDQSDYADVGNFTFGLTTSNTSPTSNPSGEIYHLPGTTSTYGIVCFDDQGRTNGVLGKEDIYFPKQYSNGISNSLPSGSIPVRAQWSLSGTAPSWATSFGIVMKKNNTVAVYSEVNCDVLFYLRDLTDTPINAATEFSDAGKVFSKSRSTNTSKVYLHLPQNIPISLDEGYVVRLMNNIGQTTDTEPIISIEGDKIVCGNFGISNWTSVPLLVLAVYIQIEKYKDVQDEFYYEIGDHFPISSGVFGTTLGTLKGDQYYESFKFSYKAYDSGRPTYPTIASSFTGDATIDVIFKVLTPSPTSSRITLVSTNVQKETVQVTESFAEALSHPFKGGLFKGRRKKKDVVNETTISDTTVNYTFDYTKIASDFGRAWIEIFNKKINYEPTTLTISDKYVYSSQINGISNFNEVFVLPPTRTPIRRLCNLGNNTLLVIHERTTTSMASYSGDRILNTANGSQILGDGTSVFGYERELTGGYGTTYPDSFVEHNGKGFFFDANRGEVVRYGANGNSPIGSLYKMRTFFKTKGEQFQDQTNRNVIGGYDPNLHIYYLTFKSSTEGESVTVAFVDKEGEERWLSFEEFIPERYSKINNRLFAFVGGVMWEHGISATYNNFYGSQKTMRLKGLFNTDFSHEKLLRNISTESSSKWAFPSINVSKANGTVQDTALTENNFIRRDDVFYADLKRDKNTASGLLPAGKSGLVAGQQLIGKSYEINATNDDTVLSELNYINYGYQLSDGHRIV